MKISKLLLVGAISVSSLFAHGLWLNSFEVKSHGSSIVTVGLGSGHGVGIEEAVSDRVQLVSYDLSTPDGKIIALKKPARGLEDVYDGDGLKILKSNLAMQSIILGKKSKAGTYSANLATKTGKVISYVNTKGQNKKTMKSKDKIRDLKEVLSTMEVTTFAKTYFVNKKWSQPKVVGHRLEIIPTTDISKLYVGDRIELEILYNGKPLKSGYITAKNSLSKGDNALFSNIRKGKASFVLTNFGQWNFDMINKTKKDGVQIIDKASATINIK